MIQDGLDPFPSSDSWWRSSEKLEEPLTPTSDWRRLPESPFVTAPHACRHNWYDAFLQRFLWMSSMWTSNDELQYLWFGTDGSPSPCPSVPRFPLKPLIAFSRLNVRAMTVFSRKHLHSAFCSSTSVFYSCCTTCSLLRLKMFSIVLAWVHLSVYHFQSWMQYVWTCEHKQRLNTRVAVDTRTFAAVQISRQHSGAPVAMNEHPIWKWSLNMLENRLQSGSSKRRKHVKCCCHKRLTLETSIWHIRDNVIPLSASGRSLQ